MNRIKLSLIISILITSVFGELAKVTIGNISLNLMDIFCLMFVLVSLPSVSKSFYIPKPTIYFGLFLFTGAVSLIINSSNPNDFELLMATFYWFRYLLQIGLFIFCVNYLKNNRQSISRIIQAIYFSGLLFILFGYIQLILLPNIGTLPVSLGWDPHLNRLTSTFLDPNYAGAFITIIIALCLTTKNTKYKIYYWFLTVLSIIALVLTYSRSSLLVILVMVAVVSITKSTWRYLITTIIFLIVLVGTNSRTAERISGAINIDATANARIISWTKTIEIIKTQPIFGVGYNNLRYEYRVNGYFNNLLDMGPRSGAGSDSSLLFVLATSGILGLLFFLSGYFTILYDAWRLRNQRYGSTVMVISLGMLIGSQFNNCLFYSPILYLLFIIWAIFYADQTI